MTGPLAVTKLRWDMGVSEIPILLPASVAAGRRQQCGNDPQRWQESREVATRCMQARVALWDGIREALGQPEVA